MNLYHLSQDDNDGYDTYSNMVVAAETEEDARLISPSGGKDYEFDPADNFSDWAYKPENIMVRLIGTAIEGTKRGMICSSYHAG